MTDLFQITTQEGCGVYVREADYSRFLMATKSLVEQQRAALRSKDKKSIAACKKRENAMLAFVEQFLDYRACVYADRNNW